MQLAPPLLAVLALATVPAAQITVDAGPDRSVVFPAPLTLAGTIGGLTPLDLWTADGNGVNENKLVKFRSDTGLSYAGPIQTTGGTLYGFVNDLVEIDGSVWGVAPLLRQMFTLNGATGTATNVGGPMSAPSIRGLAYDAVHGVLYGIDYNNNGVYTINTTTGLSTKIVNNVGHPLTSCLAYEESSGLLYAYGEASDWLFTIDPVTDVVTDLVLLPTSLDETYDELQFFEGELYGMWWRYSNFDCELRRIDVQTGDYEVVGAFPDVSSHCLLVNSVPERFHWAMENGPGAVTFSDPEVLDPVVGFSKAGRYQLSLTVESAAGRIKDTLIVTVMAVANTPGKPRGTPVPLPKVSFTGSAQTVSEGAPTVLATVQLSAPSTGDVSVPLLIGGTALGADFSVAPNPLVITAGLLSADVVVTLDTDLLDEDDETIVLTLGRPSTAALGSLRTHVVTIVDDDLEPEVTFAIAGQSAGEGAGTATISVLLSAVSGRSISVPYTLGGTATETDDYALPVSPLVILAGQAGADLVVAIVDDALSEGDETLEVSLGAPTNAVLGATTLHALTLVDDD